MRPISYRYYVLVGIALLCAGIFYNRAHISIYIKELQKPSIPSAVTYKEAEKKNEASSVIPETNIPSTPAALAAENTAPVQNAQPSDPEPREPSVIAPAAYNLAVPFQPQAPFANWSLPFKEACEEASLIMADAYFKGRGLTAENMEKSILDVVEWEKKTFGYYEDTNAEEVARTARDYFNLQAELSVDVTVANIKNQLAQNKLVIVPAAGRLLPNPYFSGEGPIYHMLVIRGYTDKHFITNDPGTKRGEAFLYTYDDLINAIHDWPKEIGANMQEITEHDVAQGRKVMVLVDK